MKITIQRHSLPEGGWTYRVLIGDFVRCEFPVLYPRHDEEQKVAAEIYATWLRSMRGAA